MTSDVLVIGEKTSQVKKFASTLCGQYQSEKQRKYVYTYSGITDLNNITYHLTFLPLNGHISSIDTRKGYGWSECAPIKIVSDARSLTVKHRYGYVKLLKKQIKNKDELWLATDPDSEGDNIAMEAIDILKSSLSKEDIPIRRIWNSSLTTKEIWRAFLNPKDWDNKLALAVQGRRLIDAWIGFAGTREITRAARHVAKIKVLSVGRVQLPTLHLIVKRNLAHESFNPKDRWRLAAIFDHENIEFKATHQAGYTTDEQLISTLHQQLREYTMGTVMKKDQKITQKSPPNPLNTTSAVSLLSGLMKISAKKALDNMVELYNRGYLSYPRTENKKFQKGFPHKQIISSLLDHSDYISLIQSINDTSSVRNNGTKKGEEDHDPIHPTGETKGIEQLNKYLFRTWDILSRYYLSLFMDDLKVEKTAIAIKIDNQLFNGDGRSIIDLGWRRAQHWINTKESIIPSLEVDDVIQIKDLLIETSKTKPPKLWTDSKLLSKMEKLNIGTKSSRPEIIDKLVDRNYIYRSGQKLISSAWGRSLIASLAPIWPDMVRPKFTAQVEELMDRVASGDQSFGSMIRKLKQRYLNLHKQLIQEIDKFQDLLKQLNLTSQYSKSKDNKQVLTQINKVLQKINL